LVFASQMNFDCSPRAVMALSLHAPADTGEVGSVVAAVAVSTARPAIAIVFIFGLLAGIRLE
jgi:hypothetical protein